MTLDSSTGSQTAPLTLNRYIYACDDPMSVVDPTGHFGMPPPDMAKGNDSPNSNPITAITNWWSGLPPNDKTAITDGVTIAALVGVGIVTCGVGDAVLGLAAGSEVVDAGVGLDAVAADAASESDFSDLVTAATHWDDHEDAIFNELGEGWSLGDYVQGARNLIIRAIQGDDNIQFVPRTDGDFAFFNPETNEFTTYNSLGNVIHTYYIPDGSDEEIANYWIQQFENEILS